MGAILQHGGHLDFTNIQSPFNTRLHIKFEEIWPWVSEEKSFKGVNGWTDDGRTDG